MQKKVTCALDVLTALCAGQTVSLPEPGPLQIDVVAELNKVLGDAAKLIEPVKDSIKASMVDEKLETKFGDVWAAIVKSKTVYPLIPAKILKELGQRKFLSICTVSKKAAETCMGKEQIDRCTSPTGVDVPALSFKKR